MMAVTFSFGCTESSLLPSSVLLLQSAGSTLWLQCVASHCGGFSLQSAGSGLEGFSSCGTGLGSWSSRALEHGLGSCGTRT